MFKNSQKISISKHFLIPLLFVVLIFTSFGITLDESYAIDANQTVDGIESELNVEDKLENSQEDVMSMNSNEENVLEADQNVELLGATLRLDNGGTFSDIKEKVRQANAGDTIVLNGKFTASGEFDQIVIDKKLKFTSTSGATLNAKGKTHIFVVKNTASGTSFNNLKLMNGYRDSYASAVHIMAKNVKITNCIFQNNFAFKGGAIFTSYNAVSAENLLIKNCQFIKNHALVSAGAVGAFGNNTRILNCTFDGNYISNPENTGLYGAALQVGLDNTLSKATVDNCRFINNHVDSFASGSHGGAGCVRNGTEYKNCIFINNSANQGGALTYHDSGLIKNCTFINNTAFKYGGAVSTGFYYNNTMDLGFVDCRFEGNEAPLGGAVQLFGKNINISNCSFDDNHASQDGGAINIDAITVVIENSRFNDNVAHVDGGAVYVKGEQTTIEGCSFNSNSAIPDADKLDDGLGGAIYVNSTNALVKNNDFYYNTARNGSAIYYDKFGTSLKLIDNEMFQNQAWVYLLPIYAKDIYYGESENIGSVIHGGNNIAKYGDLAVSNAICNAADNDCIELDGETPVSGATTSGHLYQDDREYNMDILMTVEYEDGSVVYNKTLNSNCFGEVSDTLNNLKVGNYVVRARHFEDTYYKGISNVTTFSVTPKVDDRIRKSAAPEPINYGDLVIWTLNITNNGPSNATGVVVRDILPEGLIWIEDDTDGAYDPTTGTLTIDFLEVGKVIVVNIKTRVNQTGNIVNDANITANEYDYNMTNNHDQADINVDLSCDLAVTKTVNASTLNFGNLVKWTVTVTNNGPDVAHDVVVSDVLPKGLVFVSATGDYDKNTGVWNVGTLNIGANAKIDIVCRVNATGTIVNEVSVSGREFDYNKSNNHDDELIRVDSSSDLAIVKLVNVTVANFGDLVKWTLRVSNNGPDAATGVKIFDVLPRGFNYVSSTKPYLNGIIEIGDLAVGRTVSVDIVSRVNVTGSFVNVANVSGNEYDWDLSNNRDDASILINPACDLAVVKNVNDSSPDFNGLVKWTVTVTNYGPDVAHDVVVSDVLPKELVFIQSTGSYDKNTGVWNVGTLNIGANAKIDIVCRVNATGTIVNEVSVSGREFDYNKSNNHDDELIRVDSSSDLAIVKLVNVSTANFGDLVKWTLKVSNNGPDKATNVIISDILPEGFIFVSSTKTYTNGQISIGDLAVGRTVSVDIVSRVNVTGSFVNVANVSGNEYDWNLSNNRDDASILINPACDLVVVKDVNDSSPDFNGLVKWTVTVTNYGPDVAHDVVVSDVLPKGLVFVSATGSYDENTGVWNVGTLSKGVNAKIDIVCRVNATGTIVNEVSVSGREFDYNKSNNHDDELIRVDSSSDLAIVKLVNVSTANFGDLVKWTLRVSNNGPDAATGVKIFDVLPRGFNYVSSTKPYLNGIIEIGDLAVGRTVSVDIVSRVNVTGSFVNVANVSGNEYDWNLSNNRDDASILINPACDLAVVKDVNDSSPDFNGLVKWTVTVTNYGPDVAHDVVVSDVLPKELVFVQSTGDYDENTGVWNVGTLNKGANAKIDIICRVNATGSFVNNVSVTGHEFDYNKSNNHDNETILVAKAADLQVAKLANVSQLNYGQLVKWTIIATNNGPDNATGVYVEETLPDGLILVSHTASKGIYDNGLWSVCCIESGTSQKLELVCKVNKTGLLTNFVSITGNEYDQDLSNNNDSCSISVPLSSDLAVTKQVNNSHPNYGEIIEWTITLTNNGPDDASDVFVIERLPDGLELIDCECTNGIYDGDSWYIEYLANGASESLFIRCIVKTLDDVENVATAIPSQYDWNMTNNNDSEKITVNPLADLAIVKLVNVSSANYLDLIKWTLIVYNNGPNDATGVVVSDVIPKGLDIVKVNGGEYVNSLWNVGDLANGHSKQLEIICKIMATGDFVNVANVWAEQTDPDLNNNEDESYLTVAPACDLSITKTVSKYQYVVGDLVKYSIKLTNKGPDRAKNVEVKEIMDDSLVLKSYEASYGDFDETNDVWSLDELGAGESAFLKIGAVATKSGNARNNVSVSSDSYDPDSSNNNDTVTVTVKKNDVPKNFTEKRVKTYSKAEISKFSHSVLEEYSTGNPLMVLIILFVFSLGAFCGNNILKKR